jgi:hypothetical protein
MGYNRRMIHIYTICDHAYFIHLQGLLYSFKHFLDLPFRVFVCDIGLTPKQREYISTRFAWANPEIVPWTAGDRTSYLFKIDVFQHALDNPCDYVMYQDAKNHLKQPLSRCIADLSDGDVLGIYNGVIEGEWTHDRCIAKMGCEQFRHTGQITAGVWMSRYDRDFFEDVLRYGRDPECLTPKGSRKEMAPSPRNHRQDQSVFSLCIKKRGMKFVNKLFSSNHNTIHQA